MADRCDHCMSRVGDGVTPHADDCPMMAGEHLERIELLEAENERLRKALREYVNVFLPGGKCPANDYFGVK